EIAVPWWLLASAEQRLSSSLTALLIAAVPLIGAVLALSGSSRERFGRQAIAGLGLGLVGVVALVGFNTAGASVTAVAGGGSVAAGMGAGVALVLLGSTRARRRRRGVVLEPSLAYGETGGD